MLCLSGCKLYSRWVPLIYQQVFPMDPESVHLSEGVLLKFVFPLELHNMCEVPYSTDHSAKLAFL